MDERDDIHMSRMLGSTHHEDVPLTIEACVFGYDSCLTE